MNEPKEEHPSVKCFCGAKVPLDLMAAHMTEHDPNLTTQDILDAPIVDETEEQQTPREFNWDI